MKYPFSKHIEKKTFNLTYKGTHYYIDLIEFPQYETFVNFDTWKSMYCADKENWQIFEDKAFAVNEKIVIPFYADSKKKLHFIKFLTRRDYRKFRRFWKKEIANGETYENLKEQEELVTIIRERADQNLKDALKKQAKAEEKVRQQAAKMLEDQKHREENVKETMSSLWHMTGDLYYDPRNGTYLKVLDADKDLLAIANNTQAPHKLKGDYFYDPVSKTLYLLDKKDKEFKEVGEI